MEIAQSYYNPIVRRKMRIIDTAFALLVILLSIASLLSYNYFKSAVSTEVLFSGYVAMFLLAAIMDFIPQFISPFMIIAVGLASGFNFMLTLVLVLMGSILGSLFSFYLGTKYGLKVIAPLFSQKMLHKIFRFSEKNGKFVVLITHFTPLPYIPLIFGALEIRKKDFILYGVLLRAAIFSIAAYALAYGLINYPLPF